MGIKTGYTFRAGRCLIARARKEDRDVLLVMLKAGKDRWEVAEHLFEKAFAESVPGRPPEKPLSFVGDRSE